jgi:hypothetical protein
MVHRHSSCGRRNKGEDRNWITQEAEFQARKMIDRWLKKRSTQKLKPSLAARARTIRPPTEAAQGAQSHGMVYPENIDSWRSNFKLDDCSGRRYRSLAHLQLHALNSDDPIEPRFDEKVSWSMS